MAYIFDHTTDNDAPLEHLDVHFTCPEAGWVRLLIKPLHASHGIACSYVFDPFPGLIEWLDHIAGGAKAATWAIDEEGQTSHLQFYAANPLCDDTSSGLLLHTQSSDGCNFADSGNKGRSAPTRRQHLSSLSSDDHRSRLSSLRMGNPSSILFAGGF